MTAPASAAHARPRGEQQLRVAEALAVGGLDLVRGRVDRGDPRAEAQVDVLLGVPLRRVHERRLGPALQVVLRQRRPLVRHVLLGAEEHDAPVEPLGAQRLGGLRARRGPPRRSRTCQPWWPPVKGEELGAGARVVAQRAAHARRDRGGARGPHAAQRHAHVLGLDDDAHPARVQVGVQPVGDVRGEPLLHLRAVGVQLHDAGELGEPEDPRAGKVADVGDADEGQHVVFAHGPYRDFAGEDELVVALVVGEGREVERARVEQLGVGAGHAAGGVGRAGHAQRGEERGGRALGRGEVHSEGLREHPQRRGHGHPPGLKDGSVHVRTER